ncbi:MAG TPA: hypothetical protein VGP36_23775 [Mycobacteriales bacterium]|jgi:hypothetical protein|nr:hypothetical protein [Mycobacteriales bacterium]
MERDLVEPEGVNAESDEDPPWEDPRPGGHPEQGPRAAEPAGEALGAPPDGDADEVFGTEPAAGGETDRS